MNNMNPGLYQVNLRVYLNHLSRKLGRKAFLRDIPDDELDRYVELGFEWVWLLSVWQTGEKGRELSRTRPEWLADFNETLSDLKEEDIPGSGFAITGYDVHADLGGDKALAEFRERLRHRNLKLMLDFVPNHVALDHPWVNQHQDYFIVGNEKLLIDQPANYVQISTRHGDVVFAYGRDPYFSGWPDTLQLNYSNPALQQAMTDVLLKISGQCDGVRCDMAMLILPEVFERTWGRPCAPFWPAAIKRVRESYPEFVFMAEVYWDLEWELQQQGFTYTYDKRLYDRLDHGNAFSVWEHFKADLDYQQKSVRFLENHDEPRAAKKFPQLRHEAAAVITFFCPGLRFLHQGQLQGNVIHISPHLGRGPDERVDFSMERFYSKLLTILKQPVFHTGRWLLLNTSNVSDGNNTNLNYIGFIWIGSDDDATIVVVNYSETTSQAFLKIPIGGLRGKNWRLQDLFSGISYDRDGDDLLSRGLFLDEPGWKYYVFSVVDVTTTKQSE